MTGRAIFAAVLVLALAAPLYAGDIVTMPTGNMVGPRNIELNGIYLNQPPAGSTGNNMVGEAFVGIFDRLELKILVDVSTQISPRKMAEILSLMSSEGAERLTVELANRASGQPKSQSQDQLPKIEGKPNGG